MNGVPPVRLRLYPLCLVALLVALGGCSSAPKRPLQDDEIRPTQSAPSETQAEKVLTGKIPVDEGPISLSGKKDPSAQAPKPEIERGTSTFINEAAARAYRGPLLHVRATMPLGADRLRALCPQVILEEISGTGHFVQLEAADQVNALLASFVAKCTT